jgi:hypothetical protein
MIKRRCEFIGLSLTRYYRQKQIKKIWNIIRKRLTKMVQQWLLEFYLFCTFRAIEKSLCYFVKSYLPNSRPPLVFFKPVTIHILLQVAMLQAVIYGFGGVEQTDLD